jgi:starch-binding outer membrane protein, SusD/RagB family
MKYKSLFLTLLVGFGLLAGCELDSVEDPNNPDIGSVSQNATRTQLNTLALGILGGIRNGHALYVTSTGTVARELYLFNADPRNTGDLLGKNGTQLDNNSFYLVTPYNNSYRVVKTANILLESLENTGLVSDEEKRGYEAFAKTFQAHQLLVVLNMLGTNGIRIDVNDPDNLGDFVSPEAALAHIAGLLDEAAAILSAGNVAFAFPLFGFDGLNSPAGFLQFNRALAARVAAYRQNWTEVLNHLDDSFFALNGPLTLGPKMLFSAAANDLLNPLFKPFDNTGDMIFAHASWVADAEAGDLRVERKVEEGTAVVQDDLTGRYRTTLYPTATTTIDIIRNEELILLYAEANIQLNNTEDAVEALNIIRTAAGIGPYTGAQTQEALIDEMLEQRRYSLWAEGHRMVDLRRYNRLSTDFLPIDRTGDLVFTSFPIPITENN